MKKSKAAKIIERVAIENGENVAEVRRSIQEAIDISFENRNQNDFSAAFWGKWHGRCPTTEEFLSAASNKVWDELNLNKLMKQ